MWGPFMVFLILLIGFFFVVRTRIFKPYKLKLCIKSIYNNTIHRNKEKRREAISPFKAGMTALASTMGVGNIVGVATAILAGGPGAIFWMWIAGLCGMAIKYSEILLSIRYRDTSGNNHLGGPMYYIANGLRKKRLALLFSFFGVLATIGTGNMVQANAIASSLYGNLNIPTIFTGIILTVLCSTILIGGFKRIFSSLLFCLPFMSVFYLLGGITIILLNISSFLPAFFQIFIYAFSFKSVGGGVMGYVIIVAMRYGLARGIFSNEAGLGTAPMIHATSSTKEPVEQGFWGIFEVLIDTLVINTITALVILISGFYKEDVSGAMLVQKSFYNAFGNFGNIFISLSIFLFAGTTIIGWYFYGQQCVNYLSKSNPKFERIYKTFYIVLTFIGATSSILIIWNIADTFNGLMMITNLLALILLRKEVISLTKNYFQNKTL